MPAIDYVPQVVEFDNPTLLYEYEDGYKIIELREADDLAKVGKATKNCIGAGWENKILHPGVDDTEAAKAAEATARACWDKPANRERLGDEWVEARVRECVGYTSTMRQYKIGALVNAEGGVVAALMLGEKNAMTGGASYAGYRDLGQETTITLDGWEFYLLQATYGTAWMPEQVGQRLAIWWKSLTDSWDEKSFQDSVNRYNPRSGVTTYRAGLAYR